MEDGLQNKKVGFIIQARMQSTRLPGKILMPLPLGNGKPLLSWIVDELKKAAFNNKIIVATSINKENDVLESFCDTNEIECYRGDEENVLSRFIEIAKKEHFDCIVRLTADNPILDLDILEKVINHHFKYNNDYTSTSTMPTGMNFEVVDAKTLISLENELTSKFDKEHVTLFIKNSGKFKLGVYTPTINKKLSNLRLTVDYVSDYALLGAILSQSTGNLENKTGIALIDYTFLNFPWLFEINNDNVQKKHFSNLNQELEEAIKLLKNFDFYNVAALLLKTQI